MGILLIRQHFAGHSWNARCNCITLNPLFTINRKTMMKAVQLIILCLLFGNIYAEELNEKEIKTKAKEVTVFIEGAQLSREKSVELMPGGSW